MRLADGVVIMLLDSYVVNCDSNPRPGGLKLDACACVPKKRMEEKGLWHGHPPWGVISHFLSLCLSGEHTGLIAKTSPPPPPKKKGPEVISEKHS